MPIRNSTKAIIIENGRILCNQYHDERGIYYGLPGGGQDYQETLQEAMVRECQEEIDAQVEVGELVHIREYIGKNYPQIQRFAHVHQVEFFFKAKLLSGQEPKLGQGADKHQTGVSWLPLTQLPDYHFYPGELVPFLQVNSDKVYLGAID